MSEPTPELRALLRNFFDVQRAKYGPDWKEKLAAEMAKEAEPFINALLRRRPT